MIVALDGVHEIRYVEGVVPNRYIIIIDNRQWFYLNTCKSPMPSQAKSLNGAFSNWQYTTDDPSLILDTSGHRLLAYVQPGPSPGNQLRMVRLKRHAMP